MSPDEGDSDESDERERENVVDRSDEESKSKSQEEDETPEETPDTDDSKSESESSDVFGLSRFDLDITKIITPEVARALSTPLIDPELIKQLQEPVLPKATLAAIRQPIIDPEVIRAIQQPVVDPEVLRAVQQPVIDPKVLAAIQEPIIDPELLQSIAVNRQLVETLQSFESFPLLEIYRNAIAIEQLDREAIKEIDGPAGEEIGRELEDELSEELNEDPDPPEEGGFLSTFFNASAVLLLDQSDEFSPEAIQSLNNVLRSQRVGDKTDSFHEFLGAAHTRTTEMAGMVIMTAFTGAFQIAWGVHFPELTENGEWTTEVTAENSGDDTDSEESEAGDENKDETV